MFSGFPARSQLTTRITILRERVGMLLLLAALGAYVLLAGGAVVYSLVAMFGVVVRAAAN